MTPFDPQVAFCIEGCGRLATSERLTAVTADGDFVVELVCGEHVMEAE